MNSFIKVVQFPDVLDTATSTQFHRDIENVIAAGVNVVLLDLRNVNAISSAVLMALVSAMKTVQNAGGKMFICSINEQIKMLLELTGMERVFHILKDPDELTTVPTARPLAGVK